MRKQRTFNAYPNPYAHIDANGRLAGALPVAESLRPTTSLPARQYVGATRETLEIDDVGRGPKHAQQVRGEYRFVWTGEAVVVDASGQLATYYRQRESDGDVFLVEDGAAPPLEKLARARAAAIAQYRAEQGHESDCTEEARKAGCKCIEDPDTSEWAEQFPLELDVAAASQILAKRAEDEATKAKAAQDKADADAKATADKAKAEQAAAAKTRADEAQKRARVALGIEAGLPAVETKSAPIPRRLPTGSADPAKES